MDLAVVVVKTDVGEITEVFQKPSQVSDLQRIPDSAKEVGRIRCRLRGRRNRKVESDRSGPIEHGD